MYAVFFSGKAKKFFKRCNEEIRQRLVKLFGIFELSPVPAGEYDVIKVKGAKDRYRIRLSSYRIVYDVHFDEKEIRVLKIERRDETTYD